MNLDKLKKDADMEAITEKEISELKETALDKFEEFFQAMEKSTPLWNLKMKKSVDKFVYDFVKYMKENAFDVDYEKPQITENAYKRITATYHNKNIILDSLNYDGEKIFLLLGNACVAEFWFDLPKEAPRYLFWKDNIIVSGKSTHDFGGFVSQSFKAFVNYYNTKEELQEVIKKVQINIDHFNDSLKDIDKYDYCINKFGTDETYNGFQEFIDSVEI